MEVFVLMHEDEVLVFSSLSKAKRAGNDLLDDFDKWRREDADEWVKLDARILRRLMEEVE